MKALRFSLGAAIGFLSTIFLLATSFGLYTRYVSAQLSDGDCFTAAECVGSKADIATCQAKGCFTSDRIFEPDPICDKKGDVKETGHTGRCYAKSQPVNLIIPIGGKSVVVDLGDYIAAIYTYALSVGGILATVLMMVGGFQYLVGQQAEGKKLIINSVGGLLVIFFAYIILQTVNPDTVLLKLPKIQVVKRKDFTLCQYAHFYAKCGEQFAIKQGTTIQDLKGLRDASGKFNFSGQTDPLFKKYIEVDPAKFKAANILAVCRGRGCQAIGGNCKNDKDFKCTLPSSDPNAVPLQEWCMVKDATYNPSQAFCTSCSPVGTECGPGKPPCCGGCMNGKCQRGIYGEFCGPTSGCAEGFNCIRDPNIWQFAADALIEGAIGVCYAGGIGMPCTDNGHCRDDLTCQPAFNDTGLKLCSTGPIQIEAPPIACSSDSDCSSVNLICANLHPQNDPANLVTLPDGTPIKACSTQRDIIISKIEYDSDFFGMELAISSRTDGQGYSVDYTGFNDAWRCINERHIKVLENSTWASLGASIRGLITLGYFGNEGNFEIGICSDGKLGSACNPTSAFSCDVNLGLKCVKPSTKRSFASTVASYIVGKWGVDTPYKDMGACLPVDFSTVSETTVHPDTVTSIDENHAFTSDK